MIKLMPRANGEIGRRTTLKMWRGSPSCRFESDSAHQITVISGYYGVDASIRLNQRNRERGLAIRFNGW